jgi:hypothetical protein
MVPIQPTGVVDLTFFKAADQDSGVRSGTVLLNKLEKPAKVLGSVSSGKVIDQIQPTKMAVATGPPVDIDGTLLVPIQPKGLVDLRLFEVGRLDNKQLAAASSIKSGTVLLNASDEPATVFQSVDSSVVIDQIAPGTNAIANGTAAKIDGDFMVPIRPRGAVDFSFFSIVEQDFRSEDKFATIRVGIVLVNVSDEDVAVFESKDATKEIDNVHPKALVVADGYALDVGDKKDLPDQTQRLRGPYDLCCNAGDRK